MITRADYQQLLQWLDEDGYLEVDIEEDVEEDVEEETEEQDAN